MSEYVPYVFVAALIALIFAIEPIVDRIKRAWLPAAEKELLERAMRAVPAAGPTAEQRSALKSCANCGTPGIVLQYRDGSGRTYCSDDCLLWGALGPTQFCESCIRQTTDVSPGNLHRVNGIGTSFVGGSDRCPRCRSVVRRVWVTLVFLPVFPLARYRVIHPDVVRYWARRLR
jgi:hypothetical protein